MTRKIAKVNDEIDMPGWRKKKAVFLANMFKTPPEEALCLEEQDSEHERSEAEQRNRLDSC